MHKCTHMSEYIKNILFYTSQRKYIPLLNFNLLTDKAKGYSKVCKGR